MVRGISMLQRSCRPTPLICAVCLLTSACFGPTHPDTARYEYLYMDGAFVAPYKTYPQGVERGRWQCYDGKTGETLNCTFVRGGFEHFKYIFRERG
jgi:hypothetical protein